MPLETRGSRAGSALYLTRVIAFPRWNVSIARRHGRPRVGARLLSKAPILAFARQGVCESFHKIRG
jgi:hypothetical protein